MKFPAFVLSLALAAYTSGAVVERADTDKSDWKYAVGWDGVTLPADAIGDAVAVSNTTSDLEKRATGGVYICTDVGWGGRCGYAVQPVHKCIVLGSDWSNQISSFGPDQCTSCLAYTTKTCSVLGITVPSDPNQVPIWSFEWPGDASGGLRTVNPWNDRIQSFICAYDQDSC